MRKDSFERPRRIPDFIPAGQEHKYPELKALRGKFRDFVPAGEEVDFDVERPTPSQRRKKRK
jgi:hypothetical protein